MTTTSTWTAADLEQLATHGIAAAEAERQLDLLRHPPAPLEIDRPCTVGDGIVRIGAEEGAGLLREHADAADRGRVRLFVPASGAATRMFQSLIAARADTALATGDALADAVRAGNEHAKALKEFLANLDRFAFFGALREAVERHGTPLRVLAREGPFTPIVDALLDDDGLGYAALPKGLLAFHDYPDGPRTPFEEHLFEATQFAADGEQRCRLHFTVSPAHRAGFEARLAEGGPRIQAALGASFEVGFSEQKPATDTLALAGDGLPARSADGDLVLRPAGHGALIANLADLEGDLVMVKNVDNVAHDRYKRDTFTWSRLLLGLAARLERTSVALWKRLEGGRDEQSAADAAKFLDQTFRRGPAPAGGLAARSEWARRELARPIRVCGMVPNTGEPGGGPMWVRGADGALTLQIVELSQIDAAVPAQRAALDGSTHFNPVFMALALRGPDDRGYTLADFVDDRAVIVVKKSSGGRELLALERPGLWNGAMAGWNSVFVEVPITVFNPVKSVNDLLRKEHQPG